MKCELQRRKWTYSLVVVLIEWGLLSSAALAYGYEKFLPNGILLILGAIIVGLGAIILWIKILRDCWQPNSKSARGIRLSLNFVHVLSLVLIASFALTLGWRYIAAARPDAFTIFRVSAIGSIVLLIALMIIVALWQSSLKVLENSVQ